VSRDVFSHGSQDAGDLRAAPTRGSLRVPRPEPAERQDAKHPARDVGGRSDCSEDRETGRALDEDRDSRRAYYVRDRTYLLRDSEIHSLKEIGTFRVIAAADLAKYAYGGNREEMEKDVRRLVRQSLVSDKTVEIPQKKNLRVVTLTKAGHRLLKNTKLVPDSQPIYHGLVKRREVKHDADLYRLYQKEAARIRRGGGKLVRVLLDYELKRNLNRELARLEPEKENPDAKERIAAKHSLRVVNGKIPLPDLRMQYETSELELRHIDLELATREYRPRTIAEKAFAGFSLYGRPEDARRLRRVLDEREIPAQILML
jgi:hypothetical protein